MRGKGSGVRPTLTIVMGMMALFGALLLAAACSGGSDAPATPPGSFSGGGADVSITVGGDTWEYKDGICEKGTGDDYLSLNAGNPAGAEYFGIVAGDYPGAPGTPKSATGGGDFSGQDQVVLHFRHERRDYLVKFAATRATLAADISSGSFASELTSASGSDAAVSGTFTCGK